MPRLFRIICALTCAGLMLAACAPAATPTPAPSATAPAPTDTRAPTSTAAPTATDTAAPTPTSSPVPSETPTAASTAAAAATPTPSRFAAEGINTSAFAPNGALIALGNRQGQILLMEPGTGQVLRTIEGHSGSVQTVAFSPDGRLLASGGRDQTVRLWDPATGAAINVLEGHAHTVQSVAFGRNGAQLASSSADGSARLWDASTGALLNTFAVDANALWGVAISPDGAWLAAGAGDNSVYVWDLAAAELRMTLKGHAGPVWSLAFNPEGNWLASASSDATVRLWHFPEGAEGPVFKGHTKTVWSVSFSPDGRTLASGSDDSSVRLWNMDSLREMTSHKEHTEAVISVAFGPDEQDSRLASISADKTMRLWHVPGRPVPTPARTPVPSKTPAVLPTSQPAATRPPETNLASLSPAARLAAGQMVNWSPDGGRLVVSGYNTSVRVYDAGSLSEQGAFNYNGFAAFSADGGQIILATDGRTKREDSRVRFVDAATGTVLNTQNAWLSNQNTTFLAMSRDGRWVIYADDYNHIYAWDTAGGAFVHALRIPPGATLFGASVSQDNRLLAIATTETAADGRSSEGAVRVFSLESGNLVARIGSGDEHGAPGVALSPGGSLVVVPSWVGRSGLLVWDVNSNRVAMGGAFFQPASAAAFSPDGRWLAAGSDYGEIRVLDASSGEARFQMLGAAGESYLAFSPDGQRLAASGGGGAYVWFIP